MGKKKITMKAMAIFFAVIVLLINSGDGFAQDAPGGAQSVDARIGLLEVKVKQVKASQEKIRAMQAQVKNELDQLRIWIHRG